ncbi:glycosyl hydrolase family 8 [Microbacterium sp. SSW1-59]|uniref:glycosyl hydrolase family 8 n=1 Tax=Microbacterium xanthum TaxID=3079794 RepID=UPI002AD1E4A6|nr:glycosyl hydrolase family 8 [Microbacterium sp. SSW1-59]MDZ8200255.1 glycosyl hydrolase family 8 [Microbacterium sp. SSW1-59]
MSIGRIGSVAVPVVLVALLAGCTTDAPPERSDAEVHAAAFLDQWVEDGRVVRHDQGGDTVSEGQAYGMLAAVVAADEERFDEIWEWTQDELVREDGLLAWRWEDGDVVDAEPASDAELDAARALVLAGDRFARADLSDDGVALADALLDELTVETALGRVLLPGLWAEGEDPLPYNPSYASPAAFAILGAATGDERWEELAEGSAAATEALFDAAALPPDWAQIHADGTVSPIAGASGEGDAVTYGYDAQRTIIRYAESCEPADRDLVADAREPLSYADEPAAVLDLGGGAVTSDRSPLSIVARAAASAADGDASAARDDLVAAATLSQENPTYYGRAWITLGAAMLAGDLGGCDAVAGSGS